ncbi:thiamine diphosphokinase [Angelakisella massiliensis]|uniref:thiamine diphosphokinase n=1 Tax=Angelakisella massiliensis TaxID=1871018 RepID=UPI0009F3DA68|nr:thiamine diphosphokinase [Angelakisella massiliensis]
MSKKMDRCLILCAGELDPKALEAVEKPEECYIIAADGGYLHARRLGLRPDLILGDFDSAPRPADTDVELFPAEKDDTDCMLAVKEGIARGCRDFIILGGTGGRLDHTIANIQTLEYLCDRGLGNLLADARHRITVLRDTSRTFPRFKGYLSIFALSPRGEGVTLTGMKYPLKEAVLTRGFPLGVSNQITEKEGTVSIRQGTLLVIQALEPEEEEE